MRKRLAPQRSAAEQTERARVGAEASAALAAYQNVTHRIGSGATTGEFLAVRRRWFAAQEALFNVDELAARGRKPADEPKQPHGVRRDRMTAEARAKQIAELLASGHNPEQIADAIGMKVGTVRLHIARDDRPVHVGRVPPEPDRCAYRLRSGRRLTTTKEAHG